MAIHIIQADLQNPLHAEHIVHLTNLYAQDPMGGGEPLPDDIKQNMVKGMREMPTCMVFLAYENEEPVGIANCFLGYSTFAAGKLINVHDLAVISGKRGQNIGLKLLKAVQKKAKELNCAALTLEVLEHNPARRLYERFGFDLGKPNYLFAKKTL